MMVQTLRQYGIQQGLYHSLCNKGTKLWIVVVQSGQYNIVTS